MNDLRVDQQIVPRCRQSGTRKRVRRSSRQRRLSAPRGNPQLQNARRLQSSWPGKCIVPRASNDSRPFDGAPKLEVMKLAVRDEISRSIDKAILVSLFSLDDLKVFPYLRALRIEEDASTGLACEIVQCFRSSRERRFGIIADCVNRSSRSLAHVHSFAHVSMTVVVLAVAEKKNEVSGNFAVVD